MQRGSDGSWWEWESHLSTRDRKEEDREARVDEHDRTLERKDLSVRSRDRIEIRIERGLESDTFIDSYATLERSSGAAMHDYYDVESMMEEEERVPATFMVGAKGLGQVLDPSTDQVDLPAGSHVDLPFWMASSLASRNMTKLSIPKIFGEKVKRELLADATCVDLRDRSRYYFDLGLRISLQVNQTDVAMLVLSSFRERYQRILTECFTISDEESMKFLPRLTSEERELYDAGRLSTILFKVWRQSRPGKIGNKRRRFY